MNRPVRTKLNSKSLTMLGIPRNLHSKTMEDFNTFNSNDLKEVQKFVVEYISKLDMNFRENKGIFLYGSNGVGKTFLSSMIAKEAYRCRYTTRRSTFSEYIAQYTRAWQAKTQEQTDECEDNLYTYYKSVNFLILEEVGKEIDSKVAAPILEDLLRYREDNCLPTIMCTNLDPSVLAERYGESVASLIKGNETPILIEGEDKRNLFYKDRQTK